ncbi:hypothetical protein [Flavobacterium sp. ACN6]|uniref:hypothetical protein n=1 Tax=Flavobacterium sp. ACN6 TaxID=1920426 RepID=UPI001143E98D|nr:hypothetical protein [Flavobacterium sp. ACN6]PBJ08004.1 hypothetical protein BSF42_37210 [Flavobacterium sp. ACN6]
MKTINFLFIIVLAVSFTSSAQEISCNNQMEFTSESLLSSVGMTHVKKLKESFMIFEDLIKNKHPDLFLKNTDKDFKAFGSPMDKSTVEHISYSKICIDSINTADKGISSIFFSEAGKPANKMVLRINQKFKYLSWDNSKPVLKNDYLKADIVKIPLAILIDWPFINGEINGVKGRWMFDTGNSGTLALHSKKVSGVESKVTGSGFVGSGQKFEVLEYPLINQIKVGGNTYSSLKKVRGNNYDFLEQITTEVIGQVGFNFFRAYDMKVDYLRCELTFYKQKVHVDNWKDIRKHKNYITSLPYFTRSLDSHPMIKIKYHGIDFLVVFDSGGGKGTFTIEDQQFEKLKNERAVEDFYDQPGMLYNWNNIKVDDHLTINLYGLDKEDNSPAHKPLQITEKNTLTFAHSFLSQYITIWDTKNKVIHVLAKK